MDAAGCASMIVVLSSNQLCERCVCLCVFVFLFAEDLVKVDGAVSINQPCWNSLPAV